MAPTRLLCDEMLKGLCRWLRAAGYDAEQADDGERDRDLLARARASGRMLITRDRKLMEHRGAGETVCLLECNGLDPCARELTRKLGIDWQYRPFSRCLICNRPLEPLAPGAAASVPEDVRDRPLFRCPRCGRIYWEGGHVRRMRRKLRQWATDPTRRDPSSSNPSSFSFGSG